MRAGRTGHEAGISLRATAYVSGHTAYILCLMFYGE